jgi:hypothetical protein
LTLAGQPGAGFKLSKNTPMAIEDGGVFKKLFIRHRLKMCLFLFICVIFQASIFSYGTIKLD